MLTGCMTQSKQLYSWGDYQQQVYAHLKSEGNNSTEQITALEEHIQKARSKGQQVPPGYHAHLGMLYADIGKDDQVVQELETEKTLYPESAAYMDMLLKKYRR